MASFIVSTAALERNCSILKDLAAASSANIVLALKGYSFWHSFKYLQPYLSGCCASGLWEAKLAKQHFGGHLLTYSPAYKPEDIEQLLEISSHLDFNSVSQWQRYSAQVRSHARHKSGELQCGLRINPQCSTGHTPLYDPCVAGSRLGITADQLQDLSLLEGISGLHFHTLCEQNSDDLQTTLQAVEQHFGHILSLPQIKWLNMGGGHWITKDFYDRALLVKLVQDMAQRYGVQIWLEPGEAVAIHTGILRCQVDDVFGMMGHKLAILDVSTTAHMPDVLEMPYRPDVYLVRRAKIANCALEPVQGDAQAPARGICAPAVQFDGEFYYKAGEANEFAHTYRLGAATCLAGDVCGDFSFPVELQAGDELIFDDMAHYTMVKTTMFNGVIHPDLALQLGDGSVEVKRRFSYDDFVDRLG